MSNEYENRKLCLDLTTDEGKKSYAEEMESLRYLIHRTSISLDSDECLLKSDTDESIIEDRRSALLEVKENLESVVSDLSHLYNQQMVDEYEV